MSKEMRTKFSSEHAEDEFKNLKLKKIKIGDSKI